MPYSLVFEYTNGEISEIKPIACDNPRSKYGEEDRAIESKLQKLIKDMNNRFTDVTCSYYKY